MVTESAHIQGCHGSRRLLWLLLVVLVGWGMLWGRGAIANESECSYLKKKYSCECTSSKVRCENKGIENLPDPEHFPEDLKELYLKDNKLKRVDFTDECFENLKILDLSSNLIESNSGIGKAVKVLKDLEELYLQGNNLKHVDASYLTGTKIQILDLSNNPVERFVFDEHEVNEVKSLHLRDLKYADFPIASLKVFVKLRVLDLSGNALSMLSEETFSENNHLKEIHLNNNNLSTLPENIFNGLIKLEKVYLQDNPWDCNCSLLWLHEAMNSKSIYENKDDTKCTQYPKTALQNVAKDKFTCTIGPATCVQKNKKSMFVTYSARFDVTSDPQCQQECFDRGATYFNVIDGMDSDECLCGDVNENCTCKDCSSSYEMEPGAKSTISGIKVDYVNPVLMGKPVTINLTWVVSFNTMEINFDDGSHANTTSAKYLAHTFQYPGTFNIQIKLCSSTGNCSHVQILILVSSFSDEGTMACPTNQFVKTSDPVVLEAKFNHAYNSEIVWTRTAEGESTQVSVMCSVGEKQTADGHCFYVVTEKKTWTQALEHCQGTQGGSLAVIKQDDVAQFLVSLMDNSSVSSAWIGLHKFEDLDNFNWTNGDLLGTYTKLTSTQIRGQCVYMTATNKWETESCDIDTSFICEYTPNDIVNTEVHIAGSVEIGDTSRAATPGHPTKNTLTSHSLIYMPGLWFIEDGRVQWITYREKTLTKDTNFKFVVYRPTCPTGKTLFEPGCGGNQFFSCGDSLRCITRPTCPSEEQVCYLSESCTRPSQACSCAGEHADMIPCTGNPISNGDTPEYKPVGNVTYFSLKAGSSQRLITLSANLAVKKGDFLGVLFENGAVPIECSQDMNSQWRHLRYSVSGMTGVSDTIPHSGSTVSENSICYFNALYSKQKNMTLPNSLAILPKSGKYTFSYKVLNTGKTHECTVTAMETVGEIVWVDPALNTDTIKVELNTVVSLVAKVTSGSDLTYEWMIGGVNVTSNMTISEKCPSDVDSSLVGCLTNDTSLAKPFTYVQHKFTEKTTLKLKVSNKVNSEEKELKVMLGPCMPIQGLTLCHESCDTDSGCTSPCEPLVKVGIKTSFKVKYSQGGVQGKYTYYVNDTELLKTQDSNYTTTFTVPGLQVVRVNMTCDTHSDTADTRISVKQPAKATKLTLHIPAGVVVNESFDVGVTADVENNAEVDIIISFGDGKNRSDRIVTTGGKINMVKQYVYATEERYNVTVTVSDPFENVSASDSLYALAAVSVGKIWTEPEYGKPNQKMLFRVNTVPVGGSGHVIVGGSILHYNWTFPDESKRVGSTTLEHSIDYTFKTAGAYNISLAVGNPASSEFTFIIANIEMCITGLSMEYNGPSRINEPVNFTAYIREGTNVTYSLDADDGKERINQTSPTFLVNYAKPGIYNTSLIATNDLPVGDGVNFCGALAHTQLTAYVIDNETLFLVDILPDKCFATGDEGVLAAKAINADPAKLNYTWDFYNGTTESGIGLLNVSILYNQPKTYKVSISGKGQHFVKELCIQEAITGLNISAPAPIRIVPGNMTKENIVTTVKTGSHIKYEWRVGNELKTCNASSCTINIKGDGKYIFSVNASNNVSHDVDEVEIKAQYIIQNLTLTCTTCKNIRYLSSETDAVIAYKIGNGTNVTYMYDFGSGLTSSNTFRFTAIASYEVCVNATNMVSTDKTCMDIVTQDEIQSLTLSSNATTIGTYLEVRIGTIVQFKVNYSRGTNVTMIWDCGDGNTTENLETVFICHFVNSRLNNFSVIAENKVSKVESTKEVFVIQKITKLNISHNLFHGRYAATSEAHMFTAVSNTEVKVTFHWQIKSSDSRVVCETTGKQMEEKCSKFISPGMYIVELHANNSLNNLSTTTEVTVIDRIKHLYIETDRTALAFNSTTGTDALFTAKSSGDNLYYRWKVTKMASNTDVKDYNSSSSFLSYTFREAGEYKVSVNATSALEPQGKYADKEVSIEEPISGVKITSQTFLPKDASVTFDISKSSGSDMNFKWSLSGPRETNVTGEKEQLTYEFKVIGVYTVSVEVSNQVSKDTDTKAIYVEEVISSVSLTIDQTLVRTDTVVPITAVASPSGVYKYNWTINTNQLTVTMDTFEKEFPLAGVKVVTVWVSNNVSEVTSSKKIFVQEAITGLKFEKCESQVIGEETTLYAITATGTNVTYTWTVRQPHVDDINKNGNKLTVDFNQKAIYNIDLLATNNVSSISTNCTIKVQARVKVTEITVKSHIKYNFVNQTINFEIIGDNLSDANFTWSFNDSAEFQTAMNTHQRTFQSPGTYSLQVTVNNEVSKDVKSKIFSIHILDCKLPEIEIVSKSPATTHRSRYLVLAVSVDTSECHQYQSKHSWQVYKASSCSDTMGDVMDLGTNTYTESPTLHLKARTLPTGSYCAVFNTYYLDTFVKETVNINLTVTSSHLKAIIDGGSERVVSAYSNVNISCRNSIDPDDPKTQLYCRWTCKSSNSSCPWTSRSEQSFVSNFMSGQFSVELTLTHPQSNRTDLTKQTIIVVPDPVPTVIIECVSCQTSNTFTISPRLQVALKATCTNCGTKTVKYTWKIQYDDTTLPLNASKTLTGIYGPNLVIMEGMIPEAKSYFFEVNTTFESSTVAGSSSMQLPGNTAPKPGTCSVTPRDILILENPVKVTCTGWTDAEDDQLFYQVDVKGTLSSGETQAYPVYYGTNSEAELYLAAVPNTDRKGVSLEVKILDNLGAFTVADPLNVTFATPVLDSSTTMTDYIFSQAKSSLPALLKENNPSLLLPYVIALSQELNQEHSFSPNELLSKEKRATIRDAITMSLIAIPVSTLEDVQQVAYLLQLLTKYFDEYQTERCHLVIVESLQNITTVLQGYAAQGRNQKHFVPHHLLATISNLIEAVNLGVYDPDAVSGWEEYPIRAFYNDFTNLRPELSSAMEKMMETHSPSLTGRDIQHRRAVVPSAFAIAEQIVTTILMTAMWTEKSMVINLGGIEVHGQRLKVKEIWDIRELEGCMFYLPEDLFEGNPGAEDEIFQILFVLSKNPFTWGYIKNMTINTRVPSLSFKFNDGKTIPLKNLKDSKNVKMYMFENIVQSNKTQTLQNSSLVKSEYYKPLEYLKYTRATVESKKAKLVKLDVSDGANLASSLHVQLRIQGVPNITEEETGAELTTSVDVYLGSNYRADRSMYAAHKRITTADMAVGVDHRNYTIFVSSKDFKVTNTYSLSIYNDDVFHDVNISIALYFSTCQYFNTEDKSWSTSGCQVVDESITTVSLCKCNHLTSFGSSMLAPPSVIDITDLVNLDLSTNPVVIITVGIILFVYVVLVLVFRKMDRLDLKRISMIPLCGKDGNHKFEITVVTGRAMGAGTTAHIGIKLYGQGNKGEARHLTKQGAFQRNCSDTFLVAYDKNLGSLWKILIWHDNTGLSPSWFLSHVIVKDLYNDQKYYFLANLWMSVETELGILKKELTPASKADLGTFVNSFKTAASHGFADKHLWMSLMDRPDHSRFTRVQRATCAVTVVLFFMMVNAMWYGIFKTDSDVSRAMADYSFSWEEVITGLVSNILVFPLAVLLITLFKRSRSKEDTFQQVQKPLSAQTMEIPCDMSHFGSSFRMTPHGDWDSCYDFTRESTTESIPMTAKLKRTHTLRHVNHMFSQDGSIQDGSEPNKAVVQGKSSVGSLMRTQQLMWSEENILKNWPEKVPTWHDEDRKSTAGTTRGGKATSATTSTSSRGKKTKDKPDFVDSDEEFMNKLDEIERDLSQDDIKRKSSRKGKGKGSGKKSDQNPSADGLFSSDDEWVNDGIDEVKSGKAPIGRKSINKTPARAAGATAQTRFNPREDPKLRVSKRPSFSLEEPLSSEDELDKNINKTNRKTVKVKDLPTGRYTSGKDARERKTSTSSILKKRDSLGRAVSAGSSMKETSFMKQTSIMGTMSEKSKSNMSSIWMRNYYSHNHYMREHNACCMLPSWCVYIAYVLCLAISVISIIIVLLYGYNFGQEVSLKWLLSLFLAFCCSALIIEPIKVLILAMYLAARKKDVHEEMEKESIDILPSVQSNETIKDVKFHPLGGFALLQAREEGHKVHRMYVMLRQFITHMFLLALLLSISFVHYNPHSFISSQNVELHLQRTGSTGLNLSMIKSILDFRTWTETVLADAIHRQELLPLEEFGVLLGSARFRQIRSKTDDCPLTSPLAKFYLPSLTGLPCDGNLVFTEDTDTYNEGWNVIGSNVSWRHHSPQELQMRSKFGRDLLYSGGGYVMSLGSTYNETQTILANLFDADWINLRTRAVFIEFSLYSPGLDLTTAASILVEFPISGGVLTSYSLTTQKLLRHVYGRVDPLMVCEVLFFMCAIYLVVHLALTIREQRKKFVRNAWNWLDLIILVLSLACIGAYIACVVTATDAFGHYTTHKTEFTNFEKSAHLHDVTRCLHAWLLFLFFLKIVHQLRFIKLFHVYGKTISALLGKLSGCILIFLLMLFAYAQLGYLYFGPTSQRFASFQASLLTLFGVIRGSFNFWLFLTQWPVMTHFYFYSFYAFTYGLFIALVIAVMNDTYKMTRQSMYYKATLDTQDYEMIEFIMKRFKLWAGIIKQKPAFRRVKFAGLPSLPSRASTSISSGSRRSSITSSTSSGGEPMLTEAAALYLEHQLDNAVPQWENLLSRVNKIEKLEKEEDQQMKKIEKEFKNWESKKTSPRHKPPTNTTSSFHKFQLNFKGKSQIVNKQKGLIGRTSATPPNESPRKPVTEVDDRRPFSDQGGRTDATSDPQQQKKRDSTKNVRFSKQAW